MKRFAVKPLVSILCASGLLGISNQAMATAFQLWEQDAGSSVANVHAGYAAEADNASTAWYNPAGITRFKNQQIVVGSLGIMSDIKYKGSVVVTNIVPAPIPAPTATFANVTAQGGAFSLVPNFHYVSPINDWMGFGFSVTAPFGLRTDYGSNTPLSYAATLTSIKVIDLSPSLGFKVFNGLSLGAGLDVQRVYGEFDLVGTSVSRLPALDTSSTNRARDWGYGYHLGALYEFDPCTRIGISYHSRVSHHLKGYSEFEGPLAPAALGGALRSGNTSANITLPAYTAISIYHRALPQVAFMGSVIYTQWNSFKNLTINNVAGLTPITVFPFAAPSTTIQISIPEKYRNSWTASVGADYFINDAFTLKGGVGYDQTPLQNAYRNVQLPDNNRYLIGLGAHFQANKQVGFDLSWEHVFFKQARINPPTLVVGSQTVTTNGTAHGGADVLGAQITWDIA